MSQSTIFQAILGQLSGFDHGMKCLAQGHNTGPRVMIDPGTLQSRV